MDKLLSVEDVVESLNLEPHVEGGYFRQTFKSVGDLAIATENGTRTLLTSIYYLLTKASPIGHFHRNTSHIMHYFHFGDPINYYLIYPDGELKEIILGPDIMSGQLLQFVVPGGVWKASKLDIHGQYGYGLIGEAVAPGFEYEDMQLGKTSDLLQAFPDHQSCIKALSRENNAKS